MCLIFVAPAVAQETGSWTGQKVVIKHDHPIKIGDQIVPQHGFHVYTAERTDGNKLWIISGSVKGWIPANEVVLFDQAINFYTQEIAANPGKPAAQVLRTTFLSDFRDLSQYSQ